LTRRREKLPLNPSKSTGDTLWKKANEFEEPKNQMTLPLKEDKLGV
jgi:hypothetical protein